MTVRDTLWVVVNQLCSSKLTAVCSREDKVIITYYHLVDALLMPFLIKLLNLASTVLDFPEECFD